MEVSAVRQLRDTAEAARVLGLQVHALEVRGLDDLEGAFAAARTGRADGVIVLAGPGFSQPPARLVDLLIRYTARGAVSLERLAEDANGDLVYIFSRPWSDGTTGIKLSPLEREAGSDRALAARPPRLLCRVFGSAQSEARGNYPDAASTGCG